MKKNLITIDTMFLKIKKDFRITCAEKLNEIYYVKHNK